MQRRCLQSETGASSCSARVTSIQPASRGIHQYRFRTLTPTKSARGDSPATSSSTSKSDWMVNRRALLGCALAWTIDTASRPAWAEDAGSTVDDPTTHFVYEFASDVHPNLRVKEYYSIVVRTRRQCWADIAQCIQSKNYAKLALLPTQTPFSDMRAAALYCPWALLQADDYAAATDCRKSYVDFDVHVQDLKQIAEAAAMDGANPEQVQQSFILLNASLEAFLSSIPARYIQNV